LIVHINHYYLIISLWLWNT